MADKSDLISIRDLNKHAIMKILTRAYEFKQNGIPQSLPDKIIATCFFEPSTRTKLSFETAILRLGGKVIGFSSDECLSIQKGETLSDTIRVISNYADLIVIRHPQAGAARLAANIAACPIINGGDGENQHPTQALIDLFSIYETQHKLDGISVALVGDLKYGRTIHSFVETCILFDIRLFLVAPDGLLLPADLCDVLKQYGIRFSFHNSIEEVIARVDIIYMTRLQKERMTQLHGEYEFNNYCLRSEHLTLAKANLRILHPLPRVNEIDFAIDCTEYAYYFQQAKNGLYVRAALLNLILKERHE